MAEGEVRKVSIEDIQLVQNLIERCLQLYMSQKEVIDTLLLHAKIEPGFTELVWQKLETENPEFFRAYSMRLIVKEQISRFNLLLEKQKELMPLMCQTGVASIPQTNGFQAHPMHTNSVYHGPHPAGPMMKPDHLHQQNIRSISTAYTNGASSMQPHMINMGGHIRRIDGPDTTILAQSSNPEMTRGMNGGMIKSEGRYNNTEDSPFIYGAENNLLENRHAIGDSNISPFNGGEPSSHPLSDHLFEAEINSIGSLRQISRNFSLSDLTADFSNSADILETYVRSPFLTDTNFQDPQIRGDQQDTRRLDSISEAFNYDDFGSD